MRHHILLLVGLLGLQSLAWAQSPGAVMLRSGAENFPENLSEFVAGSGQVSDAVAGRYYRLVQFDKTPDIATRSAMEREGLRFLDYIPHATYLVSFPQTYDRYGLVEHPVRSVMAMNALQKVSHLLTNASLPDWAVNGNQIDLTISFQKDLKAGEVASLLQSNSALILSEGTLNQTLDIRVDINQIYYIADLPFISWVEPITHPGEPEDDGGRSLSRANVIDAADPLGRQYDGTGINIMTRDDGEVGPHINFQGRINNYPPFNGNGSHGDMVSGVFTGAPNLDPISSGTAPGAFLYVLDYVASFTDATLGLHQTDSVMITNSSYSNGCNAGYTTTTQRVDQQINQNPSLLHVFSAGNSNNNDCGYGAGNQWGNITGGHKQGKNVIATANLNPDGTLVGSSSHGPAHDGRIKPDISATGNGQVSTAQDNTFQASGGTSAAAPTGAGSFAQLYHAYRDLHNGDYPQSSLIKALVLNSAEDYGNAGPDFEFGWGRMNAYRALLMMENNQYFSDTAMLGIVNTHTLSVPAGVTEIRAMVYWMDVEAAPNVSRALVNDLDITLTSPGGATSLPLVLDHTPNPTTLNFPATPGVDSLNNMEQVRIYNPAAGNYTLAVLGTDIPFGNQAYWVVYEYYTDEITLTYPMGGEAFVPGETQRLHWDTQPITGTFNIEYTVDNGANWLPIISLPGNFRMQDWTVPDSITGEAKVRISRGAVSDESVSPFNIIDVPTGLSVIYVCTTSANLTWNAQPGAAEYEVYLLGNRYMDSIGRSTTNSICVNINNPTGEIWFAVSAIPTVGGRAGRRTFASQYTGTVSTCTSLDIGVANILSPNTDQLSLCFTDTVNIEFTIANVGQNPQSGLTYGYQIDNDPAISQSYPGTINDCSFDTVSILAPLTALPVGNHTLKVWTNLPNDLNPTNDTITIDVDIVGIPFIDDFEQFDLCGTTANCGGEICTLSGSWVNQSNGLEDDIDWRVNEGTTPSNGTGPNTDHNPGTIVGNYLYLEASNGCNNQEAYLVSPCMNLGNTTGPELSFWYHMLGSDMGTLHLDVSTDGATWTNDVMPVIVGDQGNNWLQAIVDLSAYAGQSVQIRFRGITGNGFESDMAIDDVLVLDQTAAPSADFEADAFTPCPAQAVQFTDLSLPAASSWSWSFSPNTVVYLNGTSSTSQNPVVKFTGLGAYDVSLTATSSNGANTQTKPAYINVVNGAALPVSEDFETNSLCGTANDCELEICQITGEWTNLENLVKDDIDWRVDEGGTASNNTGPSVDHTLGTIDGNYLYLEASGGCENQEAILESACLDLSSTANPYISFWYHMLGGDIGSLHLDVFDDSVWVQDVMTPITGAQGANWLESSTNLSAYAGQTIQIRIRAYTGASFASDIAIDDILVADLTSSPLTDFTANPTETCANIPVNFTDLSTSVPSAWSWSISPNTYSFVSGTDSASQNPSVIFTATGSYSVTLIATNVNGADTLTKTNFINVGSGTVLPFMEDFQAGLVPPSNWTLDNQDGADSWENTSVIGIDGTLTNVAWIDNFGYNAQGELDALQTFTIDLDPTVASGPILSFDVAYAQFSNNFSDRLFVELSDDCGATFSNLIFDKAGTVLATVPDQGNLWIPTDSSEWRRESISLTPYLGQVIQIRFVNENGFGNSLYIDNINIESVVPPSAGFSFNPLVICEGETVVVSDSSSGNDLAYNWNFGPGATPATANTAGPHNVTYSSAGNKSISLTVTNIAGSNTLAQNVMVEPLPIAAFNTTTDNGNAFNFVSSATASPTTYQWLFGDDSTSTDMDPKHTYQSNGKYIVTMIVTNNCGSDTITQELEITTVGIEDELAGVSISITPNPNNGEFGVWIKGDRQGEVELALLDIKGRALQSKSVFFAGGELKQAFHASNLAKGVYIMRITMDQESVYRRIAIQ